MADTQKPKKERRMTRNLPYRATTAMGQVFDIDFPLHDETGSAVRVAQLLSVILETLDRDIGLSGETSNGDVMQALAMALAIRSGMVHASSKVTDALAFQVLETALGAVAAADQSASAPVGRA